MDEGQHKSAKSEGMVFIKGKVVVPLLVGEVLPPQVEEFEAQSEFFPYPSGFSPPIHLALQMGSYGKMVSLLQLDDVINSHRWAMLAASAQKIHNNISFITL